MMQQQPTLFDSDDKPTIATPLPITTRQRLHKRSRTAVDLPPLHTRSQSASPTRLSTFLPSLRSASRTTSPERNAVNDAAEFDVNLNASIRKSRPGVKSLASWFEGSSDPVNISLVPSPNKEKLDPVDMSGLASPTNDSIDNLTKRPISRPATSAGGSRFSFFRKASIVQSPTQKDDSDLSTLDIRETLFPAGPPDEFSPAAFKNLQLNAEGTLRRFRSSHIDQQRTIRSLNATKTSQADDLEASQTRNDHLKLQLIELAERVSEQDRLIAALRTELDHASSAHRSSSDTQDVSIRKVSTTSVQQQIGPYRRNRSSNISSHSTDSDAASSIVSIFSAEDSIDSPGTSVAASPTMKHAGLHNANIYCTNVYQTNVQHQLAKHAAVLTVQECSNCKGKEASEAWSVVELMRAESAALKERITELEGANDEVLGLIGALNVN
jgi:hypothetical protein